MKSNAARTLVGQIQASQMFGFPVWSYLESKPEARTSEKSCGLGSTELSASAFSALAETTVDLGGFATFGADASVTKSLQRGSSVFASPAQLSL